MMTPPIHHNAAGGLPAPVLLLASGSPRRRELLAQIGVPHAVVVPGIEELRLAGERAVDCVQRLALAKARAGHAVAQARPAEWGHLPVLGADTAVVLGEEMLGKPTDRAEALAMLARLSGVAHRVLTAVALVHAGGEASAVSESRVDFRVLDEAECSAYWESGEPRDKAGGYAVQGLGAVFIRALAGSYSGVMGLPLYETARLLDAAGVPRWQATEA
jgi:septum formation protein